MEQKRWHVQEPKRAEKQRTHCEQEKCSRTQVVETSERGKAKHRGIREGAKSRDRYSTDARILAAQNQKTIGRPAARECLTSQRLHREICCIGEPGQRYDRHENEQNISESRDRHFFLGLAVAVGVGDAVAVRVGDSVAVGVCDVVVVVAGVGDSGDLPLIATSTILRRPSGVLSSGPTSLSFKNRVGVLLTPRLAPRASSPSTRSSDFSPSRSLLN